MDNRIQWPRAKYWEKAWNPVIGCRPCSPACENCYARAWAGRFGQCFKPHETKQTPPRSGVVFCGNMTDLFGEWVFPSESESFIESTLGYSHKATYLWLTKRVGRMCDVLNRGQAMLRDDSELDGVDLFPFCDCEFGNQYFGFTAENQEWFDRRRDEIYDQVPSWANPWLSCEPLLGEIDDAKMGNFVAGNRLRWVVVGCESGPRRRRCRLEWVESVVDQCRSAGVPVFVKQLDIDGKCVTDINQFPEHLRIRQVPWQDRA